MAFVAFHFSQGAGGLIPVSDIDRCVNVIEEANANADIVIVSVHAGTEGRGASRVPNGIEYFYGAHRGDPRRYSRAFIDAGADLILGHGPHAPRGFDVYNGRLIAYSLSNFATFWGFSIRYPNNLSMVLNVRLGDDGELKSGRIHSLLQYRSGDGGTAERFLVPDSQQRTLARVMELTQLDFGSPLVFRNNGRFTPSR